MAYRSYAKLHIILEMLIIVGPGSIYVTRISPLWSQDAVSISCLFWIFGLVGWTSIHPLLWLWFCFWRFVVHPSFIARQCFLKDSMILLKTIQKYLADAIFLDLVVWQRFQNTPITNSTGFLKSCKDFLPCYLQRKH